MSSDLKQYRILVIDDNPAIHDDFRKVLAGAPGDAKEVADMEEELFGDAPDGEKISYEVDCASQGEEGLAKVNKATADQRPYAMVFCDMRMPPGWDGVQTLRELWKANSSLQTAICTAYSDYSPQQIAKELGVRGRMVIVRKPFNAVEVRQLAAMVCEKWETQRCRQELETEIETRTTALKAAAEHDILTGLPNRALFARRLSEAVERCSWPGHHCAVLFIDCDNFKTINDTLGHEAGDALLKEVSRRLQSVLREAEGQALMHGMANMTATAARLGGDEFAVLLDGINTADDAAAIGEQLVSVSLEPYVLAGRPMKSAMSIGISTDLQSHANADTMMRDADAAMYTAKRRGRGRAVVFDQALYEANLKRKTMEAELQAAIEAGQIRPYYQPIMATANRQLVGFEALARWHHPTRGLVLPTDFIPLAEETGLISPLGIKILENACNQLSAWQRDFPTLSGLTMSVNVSRKQLSSAIFVEQVEQVISRAGVQPEDLKLEVTESTVMDNPRSTADVLNRLRNLGVHVEMDDFGAGHSSLCVIADMPVTGLKTDMALAAELLNGHHAPVYNAVTTLAKGLDVPVVAEGIESEEQFAALKSLGCEYAQGYLFGKPMAAHDATQLLMKIAGGDVRRAA